MGLRPQTTQGDVRAGGGGDVRAGGGGDMGREEEAMCGRVRVMKN